MSRRPYRDLDPRYFDESGGIRDFMAQVGDQPAPRSGGVSGRCRWGGTRFLNVNRPNNVATLIDTGDLGQTETIAVQLRFAPPDAQGNPTLPWRREFSNLTGSVNVVVRRGVDPDAVTVAETSVISGSLAHPPFIGGVLPFDKVNARSLGVDVELAGASIITGVWVECIATIVSDIATRQKINGYPRVRQQFLGASAAAQNILIARPDRASFIICNTSPDADLILSFDSSQTASWVGPVGSVVLPRNIFAQYEAPIGGYRGSITGIWTAAPTGGALITEGVYDE